MDIRVAFDSASCRTDSRVIYRTAFKRSITKFVRKHLKWNYFFSKVEDLGVKL